MPDSLRRAIRSLAQIGTINAVIALLAVFELIDWTPAQVGAVNAVALPLLTFLHNFLEDNSRFPSVLKGEASSGVNPVTHDAPGGAVPE